MRAIQVKGSRNNAILEQAEVPTPSPGDGKVLIRVRAAGVTPTELLWDPTWQNKDGSARSNAIPGHEFSGVIAALGAGATEFSIGDEIYGMNDWFADGATADYCVAAEHSIAPRPAQLTHAQAAAVPIGALTAWQGLLDRAKLRVGERILVHGASGAVGVFVVQLARRLGAEITATTSARTVEFVAQLGAQQVLDYAAGPFEQAVHDFDVVFDCVGGDTLRRSWSVLKHGGRMVTIAAAGEATEDPRVKDAFFIVEPNRKQLVEVGGLLSQGELRVFVEDEVPISEASATYSQSRFRRLGYGKTVIVF